MQAIPWKDFSPRAFARPTVVLVDFGGKNGPEYCVAGTDYGYLHTTGGDIRTWRSYSGARRVCRAYIEARK